MKKEDIVAWLVVLSFTVIGVLAMFWYASYYDREQKQACVDRFGTVIEFDKGFGHWTCL